MSIAFYRKSIHCPHCQYEGSAQVKGTGGSLAILGLIALIIGFWFLPLFIVAALLFVVATIKPARQICPKCKYEYPVPLSQWEQQNDEKMSCPYCAELIQKAAVKCKHCGSDLPSSVIENSDNKHATNDESYKKTLAYKAGKLWKRMTTQKA